MPTNGAKPQHIKLRDKRNKPNGPFVWMTRELLESDAWRTADRATRVFVDWLMLEHMAHAGTENGNLIATFGQLTKWGISRGMIHKAQKEAIRRGLVYRTSEGAFNAGHWPNTFGLGWLPGRDGSPAPNRWKAYVAPKPTRSPPKRRAAPTLDIYRGTILGTVGNGSNPPVAADDMGHTVPNTVLGTVPNPILGKNASVWPGYTPEDMSWAH
jgi:hypothetical protein